MHGAGQRPAPPSRFLLVRRVVTPVMFPTSWPAQFGGAQRRAPSISTASNQRIHILRRRAVVRQRSANREASADPGRRCEPGFLQVRDKCRTRILIDRIAASCWPAIRRVRSTRPQAARSARAAAMRSPPARKQCRRCARCPPAISTPAAATICRCRRPNESNFRGRLGSDQQSGQ